MGDLRRRHFPGKSIELPADLTEVQRDGRACIRCGHESAMCRDGLWPRGTAWRQHAHSAGGPTS